MSSVAHSNVGLGRKSEFSLLPHVVDVSSVVFLDSFFLTLVFAFRFNWLDFLCEMIVLYKELVGIDSCNDIDRNVRSLVLEASMDVNVSVN